MDFYTLTAPTSGSESQIDFVNQLMLNVERLQSSINVFGAFYTNIDDAISLKPNSAATVITFSPSASRASMIFDNVGAMDSTRYDRLVVPNGFGYARLIGSSNRLQTTTVEFYTQIYKNGLSNFIGNAFCRDLNNAGRYSIGTYLTPWMPVVPGDYFQLVGINTSSSSVTIGNPFGASYTPTMTFGIELKL